MGTINPRKRADGSTAYSAQIVIIRDGQFVHRESRTFNDRAMAKGWIEKRERELAKPGGLEAAQIGRETLADAIDKYLATSRKRIGENKVRVLKTIKDMPIAAKRCADVTSQDCVALAEALTNATRQPATVGNYLSYLQSVFAIAKPAWGFDLDPTIIAGAIKVTRRLGLTSKSRARSQRPTLDELDALMAHFAQVEAHRSGVAPMRKIIAFGIFSTRRQEEITRIAWADLEPGRVLVRDMKHPGDKIGNDTWCNLVPEAEQIIASMPQTKHAIFPVTADAISAAFTRACKVLQIEDLHFHDLRHEGISRLFEMGWTIPQVAAVSGHRSWQSLQRYTHLRHTGDRYKDWKWLRVVTGPQKLSYPPP
jgi:integrase